MLPENQGAVDEGTGGEEAGAGSNGPVQEGGGIRLPSLAEDEELQRGQEGEGPAIEIETAAQNVETSGRGGCAVDPEDTVGAGRAKAGRKKDRRPSISKQTFRAAFIASGGNPGLTARALGCSIVTAARWAAEDPELVRMYSLGDPPIETPTDVASMARRPDDLAAMAPGIELVDQVADMDREMYRGALREHGVSEKQLKKLKALDGLAKNGGRLLSVSLQMTHQNYVAQLHHLAEVADDVKERLIEMAAPRDGQTVALNIEEYSALAKVYVECVKQAGSGYELMMKGTEAMVRMMAAAKGKSLGNEKAQSGWGPMKKVRPNT